MSAVIATEAKCQSCGLRDGDVGNWDAAGRWQNLRDLFSGRYVHLPVRAREIEIRTINGRSLCQRCAGVKRKA